MSGDGSIRDASIVIDIEASGAKEGAEQIDKALSKVEQSEKRAQEAAEELGGKVGKTTEEVAKKKRIVAEGEKKRTEEFEKQKTKAFKQQQERDSVSIASMSRLGLAAFGAAVAIGKGVLSTAQNAAVQSRLSENLGVNVNQFSALGMAANEAGGSAEGVAAALRMLSAAQTELRMSGQTGISPYLNMLKVSLSDSSGRAKEVSSLFLEIADAIKKLPRTEAFNIAQSMGFDEGAIQLMLKSRQEIDALIESQKKNNALTKEQAKAAEEADKAARGLQNALEGVSNILMVSLTPALTKILNAIREIIQGTARFGGEWGNKIKDFWGWITGSRQDEAPQAHSPVPPGSEQKAPVKPAWGGSSGEVAGVEKITSSSRFKPVLDVIAQNESGKLGYSALSGGRSAPLETMTLAEVMQMQRLGLANAVGRYQVIPSTLIKASKELGLSGKELFNKELQDRIGAHLLPSGLKTGGDNAYSIARAIAQTWRGVADPATGLTYGDKFAKFNKAGAGSDLEIMKAVQQVLGQDKGGAVQFAGFPPVNRNSQVSVTNNINVQANGAANPREVGAAVEHGVSRAMNGTSLVGQIGAGLR